MSSTLNDNHRSNNDPIIPPPPPPPQNHSTGSHHATTTTNDDNIDDDNDDPSTQRPLHRGDLVRVSERYVYIYININVCVFSLSLVRKFLTPFTLPVHSTHTHTYTHTQRTANIETFEGSEWSFGSNRPMQNIQRYLHYYFRYYHLRCRLGLGGTIEELVTPRIAVDE